jgi:hypothetical protein
MALHGSAFSAMGAGLAASIATVTRPNLVPLLFPLGAVVALWPKHHARVLRLFALGLFSCGAAIGVLLVICINSVLYGSGLKSGYGSLPDIYSLSFVATNARRYPTWLWQTHSPYVFGALLLPLTPYKQFTFVAISFTLTLSLCYLFYTPFDHWSFLRFLLPSIPLLIVGSTALAESLARRWTPHSVSLVLAIIGSVLTLSYVHTAAQGDAFRLKTLFRERYIDVARAVRQRTNPKSAIICLLESGSLRYYTNRLTLRYDLIEPNRFADSLKYLDSAGYTPYLALEETEIKSFTERFGNYLHRGQKVIDINNHVIVWDAEIER